MIRTCLLLTFATSLVAAEPWTPAILADGEPYLPDWSYAGYRWGDEPLPTVSRRPIRWSTTARCPTTAKTTSLRSARRSQPRPNAKDGS